MFQLPKYQRLGMELNTLLNAAPTRWEFKLFFNAKEFPVPKDYDPNGKHSSNFYAPLSTPWYSSAFKISLLYKF